MFRTWIVKSTARFPRSLYTSKFKDCIDTLFLLLLAIRYERLSQLGGSLSINTGFWLNQQQLESCEHRGYRGERLAEHYIPLILTHPFLS